MTRQWAVWSIVAVLTIGGCSGHPHHRMTAGGGGEQYWQKGQQEMAALVDRTVKDPEKGQRVKGIVSEIVTELQAARERESDYHRQLYTLNTSYTATPEEFMKIIDEGNNHRMRTAAKLLSLRFKMKDHMTADEWQALSDQMLAYSSRYQHRSKGARSY